jgi:pyridinium-3,5-biscarboxylic acid mononucleotide sulfurtransferase
MHPSDLDDCVRPSDVSDAAAKEARLVQWLQQRGSVLVGFSGGVDSTYLACMALGTVGPARMLAVTGRSASVSDAQWSVARDVATRWRLPWLQVETDELADPRYAANPTNRCYYCKHELWSKLVPIAMERGFAAVLDGTNADDLTDHRPGGRAAAEYGVLSPLALLGFHKSEIRERSRALGLPTWNQPSAPCLASRLPYGTPVTVARLQRVEAAELALRAIGVTGDLRVRDHGDLARVEVAASTLSEWLASSERQRAARAVRSAGYERVAIDLGGFRSGSLNVLVGLDAA